MLEDENRFSLYNFHQLNGGDKMFLRVRRRLKTLVVSFGILTVGMFFVLNVLASEFSVKEFGERITEYGSDYQRSEDDLKFKAYENSVNQVQRKPKTTNLKQKSNSKIKLLKKYELEYKLNDKQKRHEELKNGNEDDVSEEGYDHGYDVNLNSEDDKIFRKAAGLDYVAPAFRDEHDQYYNTNNNNDDDDVTDEDDDDDDYDDDEYDDDQADEANVDDNSDEYNELNQLNTNAPFKPGDFGDITGLEFYAKPKLKYEEVKFEAKDERVYNGVVGRKVQRVGSTQNGRDEMDIEQSRQHIALTESNIFWSSYVESLIPKGVPYVKINQQLQVWKSKVVQTLEKPSWDKCGRPQNGFVVLEDGTKMCARYREPHNSFVYGESLSFFLSRMLKMDNVPAVILSTTNSTSTQWRAVNISSLTWEENKTVALIQWIEDLNTGAISKAYIPKLLLEAYKKGVPITSHVINNSSQLQRNPAHLAELVQWGTMIVFDYLTGNYDRVASMQDAADRENNPHIMEESIRNLHKSSSDGKLWLIDNESGLLDAYDLLEPHSKNNRFTTFHNEMLQTMCVFQPSLIKAVKKLYKYPYPYKRLLHYALSLEPLLSRVTKDEQYLLFSKMFDLRLKNVVDWIEHCETLDWR